MNRRLFVGNLPYKTTEADLKELFSQVGDVVSVHHPIDKGTQRPRGFAFVEMATDDQAQAAIAKFDKAEFAGRPLTVNIAQPKEERPRSGPGLRERHDHRRGSRRESRW